MPLNFLRAKFRFRLPYIENVQEIYVMLEFATAMEAGQPRCEEQRTTNCKQIKTQPPKHRHVHQ